MRDWWTSNVKVVYLVCKAPFQISGSASGIQDIFRQLGIAVLQKKLTGIYRRMFKRGGFVSCV